MRANNNCGSLYSSFSLLKMFPFSEVLPEIMYVVRFVLKLCIHVPVMYQNNEHVILTTWVNAPRVRECINAPTMSWLVLTQHRIVSDATLCVLVFCFLQLLHTQDDDLSGDIFSSVRMSPGTCRISTMGWSSSRRMTLIAGSQDLDTMRAFIYWVRRYNIYSTLILSVYVRACVRACVYISVSVHACVCAHVCARVLYCVACLVGFTTFIQLLQFV